MFNLLALAWLELGLLDLLDLCVGLLVLLSVPALLGFLVLLGLIALLG